MHAITCARAGATQCRNRSCCSPEVPTPLPVPQLPGGTTADTIHVESRIRAAGPGQGLWSALWLLPPSPAYGTGWPASGEVRFAPLCGDEGSWM